MACELSVLLVDDEDATRQVLRKFIKWQALDIHKVYEAEDGLSALALARTIKPSIIISDIKMPYMNGIDFASELKELLPECKFVFLTAYADKDYLKSAIKLKVANYIEKPIDIEEIFEVVQALVEECKEEERRKAKLKDFSEQQLLLGMTTSSEIEDWYPYLIRYKPYFKQAKSFAVAALKLSKEIEETQTTEYEQKIRSQFLSEQSIVGMKNQAVFVLVYAMEGQAYEGFVSQLNVLVKTFVFISCSIEIHDLKKIKGAWDEASCNLSKHFLLGDYKVYSPRVITSPPFEVEPSIFKQLERIFREGDEKGAEQLLQKLTFDLKRHENTLPEYVTNLFYQFGFILMSVAESRNIPISVSQTYTLHHLGHLETLEAVDTHFRKVIKDFFAYMHKVEAENVDPFLKVLRFLQTHYKDSDLSIQFIASQFDFAPNYLCALFKKRTDKTINQYITTLRIEKAKELLRSSNKKLCDIAQEVGYTDGKYFTKVFLKATGISPKQYRERHTYEN